MSLTPLAITMGPKTADFFCRLPLGGRFKAGCAADTVHPVPLQSDHLVIVGYGLNGKNLANAAKAGGIPYVVIDLNPSTVSREHSAGENIFFGDATNAEILTHANIEQARILVIVINDPLSARAITALARQMNPHLSIIVRTRFLTEVKRLIALGADEVIPEEFETSVEIFTRVLKKYLIPEVTIDRFVRGVRVDTYEALRNPSNTSADLADLGRSVPNLQIATLRVEPGSAVQGKTLGEINVRKNYSVSILAIKRGNEVIENPAGDVGMLSGDDAIVIGTHDAIGVLAGLFRPGERDEGNL